jgi:hypothetical protein
MVKGKAILPVVLMLLFALTRWPGFMPQNFSTAYALMFCAGVFFPRRLAWWLPMATMAASDLLLNWYYHSKYGTPLFSPELIGNYIAYALLIGLGKWFGRKASFVSLLAGGFLGAVIFYLVTNTLSWFFNPFNNPEYVKTLAGWFTALTRGTSGYASTWEFFRNTLSSGGLFTGLFAGAMKLADAAEPKEEKEPEEAPDSEAEPESKPEEAKA